MRRPHYSYVILVTGFFILFFSGGSRFAFGLMLKPMSEDLEVSRSTLSLAVTTFMVVSALAMPFEKVTDDEWEGDFDLKVWGAVRFIRAAIPHMRKVGGGRIINVTNLGGRTPGPSSMPTSISRAAGIAITKGLSKDLAEDNILVSTVCIGLVKSGQHLRRYEGRKQSDPGLTEDAFYDQMAQTRGVPLGRVAEAEEAGDVIAFLASARASYLTGIAVNLDGGASAVV